MSPSLASIDKEIQNSLNGHTEKKAEYAPHQTPAGLNVTTSETIAPIAKETATVAADATVLENMGRALNADFSSVTLHANSKRAENLGALAFCEGEHIYFAPGQYNPAIPMGLQLIGHELVHVLQQRAGRVRPTSQHNGTAINNELGLEAEAEELGRAAANSVRIGVPAANDRSAVKAATTQSNPVAQLEGSYEAFDGALTAILATNETAAVRGAPSHPGTYDGVVAPSCYLVLWNVFKALQGTSYEGRSTREWARLAIDGMEALGPELIAHDILPQPLLSRMRDRMAPIVNPNHGSSTATILGVIFSTHIDLFLRPAAELMAADVEESQAHLLSLRAVMVGAASILSDELTPTLPQQIVNADSPYNYLHYQDVPGIERMYFNGLQRLYQARWEVTSASRRSQSIVQGRRAFGRLFSLRRLERMLRDLTTLAEAEVSVHANAIMAGIQSTVSDRMDAIEADRSVPVAIARDGATIPPRVVRPARGGRRPPGPPDPITYAEGTAVTPWNLTDSTTHLTALEELGTTPHMTFNGLNIGPYNGSGYPYVYNNREYLLVVHDMRDKFFGVKYAGGSHLTTAAVGSLLEAEYFTDIQKILIRGAMPQIRSEGGISSINTYDNQYVTVAGRGEKGGRVSLLVDAAKRLTERYEPENYALISNDLAKVGKLVEALGSASTVGTPGENCIRFDMARIDKLIDLLENPLIHRAMTFAKLNDEIVGFFGGRYRDSEDHAILCDRDLDAALTNNLNTEINERHLHEVIVGVAMHHRLGFTRYNPIERAIAANNAYPQAAILVTNDQPDLDQLSKQVAYLTKVRIQLESPHRGDWAPTTRELGAITNQKVADFETFFASAGLAAPSSGYFNYAMASQVLPFWAGHNNFIGTPNRPNPATFTG